MLEQFVIQGGNPLSGTIKISGAKNAALPILACALLTDQVLTLQNVPDLVDIQSMNALLAEIGVDIATKDITQHMQFQALRSYEARYELMRKMRTSVLVMGPLLARFGHAHISLPGGCAIGNRPVDLHIEGLRKMGADITLEEGFIKASVKGGLKGAVIDLPFPSVGATENIMMAATLADGQTIINNAAKEPEIIDLTKCLTNMGARIQGAGTDQITIDGVSTLQGTIHKIIPDRIETVTYAIAALMTGGKLCLQETDRAYLQPIAEHAQGAVMDCDDSGITVSGYVDAPFDIATAPYPGLATDIQAQFMALATTIRGTSTIQENIFENRFMHVPELCRMGADITLHGAMATIQGGVPLMGAPVMATDIRASAALVLAALAAKGTSTIYRIYHLDRGYAKLAEKLEACGASIQRTPQMATHS